MSQDDNFDQTIQDAQANPEGMNHTENTDQTSQEAAPESVDYKVKFGESSKEALRLLEETREQARIIAELQAAQDRGESHGQAMENLYPGFAQLDAEAQANIIAFSEGITKKVREEFSQLPEIAFTRKNYNENVWDNAFNTVLNKYPELADSKDEFKSKYFNANNVPSNIESILDDVAKIHLFDKAKEIGAKEEVTRKDRVETERVTGGDRTVPTGRTLEEWNRLAMENPSEFASQSKQYNADLESGKI